MSKVQDLTSSSLQSDRPNNITKDRYSSDSALIRSNSSSSTSNQYRKQSIQYPLNKSQAIDLVNEYLQAKSEIFSPPFDRELASEVLTGKALHDVLKPDGSIDWLINNNAYYRYGERKAEPLTLFWSDNNQAELDVKIYEEYYFYKNNRLAKKRLKQKI